MIILEKNMKKKSGKDSVGMEDVVDMYEKYFEEEL